MFKPDSGILRLGASSPGVEPFLSGTDIVQPLKSHLGQESLPIVCEAKCVKSGCWGPRPGGRSLATPDLCHPQGQPESPGLLGRNTEQGREWGCCAWLAAHLGVDVRVLL